MWRLLELFKRDKRHRRAFNRGYLDGVYFPDKHLPLLKKGVTEMAQSSHNLKKMKAKTQGFLLGYQDRNKSRLAELEKLKSMSSHKNRGLER